MKFRKLPGFLFLSIFLGHTLCFAAIAEKISLLATDLLKWQSIDATFKSTVSKGTVAYSNGVFKFGNTKGLWPGMKYDFPGKIAFNLEKDRIAYEFTPGISTNIILYFQDNNGETQFVYLNPGIAGVVLDSVNCEILPSQNPYQGEMALGQLNTGSYNGKSFSGAPVSSFVDKYGNIFLTGVRIDIIGSSGKTVDFKTLAVQTPDKTTSKTTGTLQTGTTSQSKRTVNATNGKTSSTAISGTGTTGKETNETNMPVSQKGSTTSVGQPTDKPDNGAELPNTSVTQNYATVETPGGSGTENSNISTIPAGKRDTLSFNKIKLAIPVVCGIFLIIALVYYKKYPQKNNDSSE